VDGCKAAAAAGAGRSAFCLFALERDGVEEGHGRAGQEYRNSVCVR
jgi:hypothetical protein